MKLIIGLGNPGAKYQMTRHNIGFMVVDALNQNLGNSGFKSEHKALVNKIHLGSTHILLAKPQTYMNLSGESVRLLMDYYGVSLNDVLIIHDDIDQDFGGIKFQAKRGHGGHNGIRNIHQVLGTNEYARLKLGVGRPNGQMDVASYVLQDFSKLEIPMLMEFLSIACETVEYFCQFGLDKAATKYNSFNLKESL